MTHEIDWDKYTGDNVNAGFFKSDTGYAISFHIRLEDEELKEKYEELVWDYGGSFAKTIADIHPRTVVLIDPETQAIVFSRPIFRINYIIDCLESNELLSLNDYLFNKLIKYDGIDFMNVIFWRTSIFKDETDYLTLEIKDQSTKNSRERYSRREKESMLKFILGKNDFSGLKGDQLWKQMEKYHICPKRTYQSMKNHFLKTLVHELNKFDFLTNKEKLRIKENCG